MIHRSRRPHTSSPPPPARTYEAHDGDQGAADTRGMDEAGDPTPTGENFSSRTPTPGDRGDHEPPPEEPDHHEPADGAPAPGPASAANHDPRAATHATGDPQAAAHATHTPQAAAHHPQTAGGGARAGRRAGPWRWRELGAVALQPFALALFRGDADPPPRSRRLSIPVPRGLRVLIPAERLSLVRTAELLMAVILFLTTQNMARDWTMQAAASGRMWVPLPETFALLCGVAASLPVALRDRWPLAAWRTAFVLLPISLWTSLHGSEPPYPATTVLSYLLVLYSVAVRCDRRITLAVWVLTVLTAWIVHPNSMAIVTVVAAVIVLFGYNVRVRRTATSRLAEEERRSRLAEDAQAVLEERARIARELHDVVAHHMSVIAIQAEAVPIRAAGDPVQLEAGLAEIRNLSLEAIAELRQVLGVLRDQDGRTETTPQPGLDRVDELVANARSAGLAVLVKRSGSLDGLGPAVELSAYRIVQESLSNAMRHAPGAAVGVELVREGDELRLRVANSRGTGDGGPPGAGQGLVGMRERASLLNGTLAAGPTPSGGFEVAATLPITAARTGTNEADDR
ncbi:sensor histidine kinase [Nonomuraea wenchangensis]|uniref:sensor histidine kinase n=1 Tax=Nonomuraea wenchangensis TaxID=568860 RepID=UPI000AF2E241|nr:sensor histidine kinase [Nonomuraea wenchangensis]